MQYYGIAPWELSMDLDGDGYTTEDEYRFGTNPWDGDELPLIIEVDDEKLTFHFARLAGVNSVLESSEDLQLWEPITVVPPEGEITGIVEVPYSLDREFFRARAEAHADTDGDGLLDFEETILCTDPENPDTDGDGLSDGYEVLVLGTDPCYGDPLGRGSLEGRVVLDDDGDSTTRTGTGLEGWLVFLDEDGDGLPGFGEPAALTDAQGRYRFPELDPGLYRVALDRRAGWAQVFPAAETDSIPDGYPDRVASFLDSGLGPIPGPYGKMPDELPGLTISLSYEPEPVDLEIVTGAPPAPPWTAPAGAFGHISWLTLPEDSEIVLAFDGEEIFDGPGADLLIHGEGKSQSEAEIWVGSTPDMLELIAVVGEQDVASIDLAEVGWRADQPVRFVKVRGLDLNGSFPGFELIGVEALHYRPLNSDTYLVEVRAGEVTAGIDFGVLGIDRPPSVTLGLDAYNLRVGDEMGVQVVATDDLGPVASVQLDGPAGPIALDEDGRGTFTAARSGLVQFVASAIDSSGQETVRQHPLVILNADGSLPELNGLSIEGDPGSPGGPIIEVHTPLAGEVVPDGGSVVGSVRATNSPVAQWRFEYALADQVDPEDLTAPDPDYVLVNEGTNAFASGEWGDFPPAGLAPGAYLLRFSASDSNGTTPYHGRVVGVGVDASAIRPSIDITSPENNSSVTSLTEIRGTISSAVPLRSWSVELARMSEVDPLNLGAGNNAWKEIGGGVDPVTDHVLAQFDPAILPNDSYLIRISAWNRYGLGWAEPLVLHVEGMSKPGNFRVDFVDARLRLSGIPIEVHRVYDSLDRERPGDFGYGWRFGVQEADIRETVPETGTGFLATPLRKDTRVYLTAPDGTRIGFTFEPETGQTSLLGTVWRAVFRPDPGVHWTLEVEQGDRPFLSIDPNGGHARLFFIGLPWNPDVYILTDPSGMRYTYDQEAGLLEIEDASGNRVTFTEEAILHSSGEQIELVRDGAGRITQIREPDGAIWSYEYDGNGDLTLLTRPGGETGVFSYTQEPPHLLTEIHDPLGQPFQQIEYDEDGRVIATTDAAGVRREQLWDPAAFTGTLTDGRGNVTVLEYDERGNVTRRIDPLGGVATWEYGDERHPDLKTAETNENGTRTTFQYDGAGRLLRSDGPLRNRNFYQYDENGHLIGRTYGTGGSEIYEVDAIGRTTWVRSSSRTWSFDYDAQGRVASLIDGEEGQFKLEYDRGSQRPNRVIAPDGRMEKLEYNRQGHPIRFEDAGGAVTAFEYDSQGRPVRQIDPAGGEVTVEFDEERKHLPASVTNRAGRTRKFGYDAVGNLTSIEEAGGSTIAFEYDADGHRTAVIDALGNRTAFEYDALGRVTGEIDPLGGRKTFTYDAAGNVIESVDRNGRKRTFRYDALSRLIEELWHDPADDSVIRTLTYDYDASGFLSDATDAEVQLRWVTAGAVPSSSIAAMRTTYPGRREVLTNYSYDGTGRKTGWTMLGIAQWRATRGPGGAWRIITGRVGDHTLRVESYLNAQGSVEEIRRFSDNLGAKLAANTRFPNMDPRGWATEIAHADAAGEPLTVAGGQLDRNGEGEIEAATRNGEERTIQRDGRGQLTSVSRNALAEETYAYDANGNRLEDHRWGEWVVGVGNRVLEAGPLRFDYDGEGNIVEKRNIETGERRVFHWDWRNRLTAAEWYDSDADTEPERIEYHHDPLDRRIGITRGGETTWTYYDAHQPIADYRNLEDQPETVYFTGEQADELLGFWRRDEGVYHVLADHLGSIEAVLDAEGNAVARYEYDAFGNLLLAEGDRPEVRGRFGFVGRETDEVSGCYWLRARWYDPEIGRFLSPDPLGFSAGDGNLYCYAGNQPMSRVDPLGTVSAAEYTILVEAFGLGVLLFLYCDIVKGVGELWAYVAIHVVNALNGNPLPPAPPGKGGLPSAVTGPVPTWEDLLPVNPGCLH